MSVSVESASRIIRHVWTEPRFRTEVEWHNEVGLNIQLQQQLGRVAMEQFADGDGWPDSEKEVTLTFHEMPDWDWWEPRYDSPGRRLASRDREFHER
jgi:hypothetical protein